MDQKVASLLSLCVKAGMLRTGEETVEKLLRNESAQLVIIAGDAADNTKRKFTNKCFYYKKPIRIFAERGDLSRCVGEQNRTVYCITDAGFAARILEQIDTQSESS